MVVLEQALAYVCCSAEEGKTKVQRYCRKIYELGYVPICPQYSFSPFLDDGDAEDMQAMRRMSHQILRRCRMVVVCGKETTGTMNTEISMADSPRQRRRKRSKSLRRVRETLARLLDFLLGNVRTGPVVAGEIGRAHV